MGKYALILVMALSFAVMIYALTINTSSLTADMRNVDSYSIGQARSIAQSAAQVAVAKILDADDTEFNPAPGSTIHFPADGTSFSSWADLEGEYRLRIQNQDDTLIVMQAIGRFNGREYPVRVGMANDGTSGGGWPVMDMAVFAEETIDIQNGNIVGNIGTNSTFPGTFSFGGNPNVRANQDTLFVGPGVYPGAVISVPHSHGPLNDIAKENLPELRYYPLPHFPESPDFGFSQGSVTTNWPNIHITLDPHEYNNKYFDEIKVESSRQLTFNVGDSHRSIRVGHLNLEQGDIHINGSGSLTIYVDDNITISGSSKLNYSGETDQLFVYYNGESELRVAGNTRFNAGIFAKEANIVLVGSGQIFGHIITGGLDVSVGGAGVSRVVYAPNAHVRLHGSGATGAIVANTFRMNGNPLTYSPNYDSELPELTFEDTGGEGLRIASWN